MNVAVIGGGKNVFPKERTNLYFPFIAHGGDRSRAQARLVRRKLLILCAIFPLSLTLSSPSLPLSNTEDQAKCFSKS